MGVLPTPNHLALIRDCYPPHTTSESELPRPVSNAVSKLAFYAVNRPAKLPKVVAALTDRATKATGGTPLSTSTSSTAHAHPVKNRVELAVTCEIFRTLVIECAESGNQGSAELVKSALAEPALSVADMALGGGGSVAKSARDANTRTASPTLRRPDAELEARGASLFHAVATMTTPPFFGFGLAARQYQRCLATLSARVQLTGAADHTDSRYVALKALEGAARSDIMFATGSDFDRQVGQVAPALFCTCLASSPSELEERLLLESDSLSPLPSSLRSRKATAISPPSSSSSDNSTSSKAPPPISEVAVYSLAHLSRHSTVPQLLVIHSNFLSYLEEHASAPLTRSPDDVASESSSRGGPAAPAIAKTLLAAAPEPHRSPALSWWADRAAESTYPGRTIALLEILRHLVVGLAAPAPAPQEEKSDVTDHRPVSLNASGILNTLAEMLVVRSSLAGSASDPVVHSIYSTLAALVETSDRIGYPSQLDDLASETITLLAALNQSEEHEFPVEEVRIERLTAGMDGSTKARARERLVVLLKMLVEPARAAGVAAASTATRIDQHLEEQIPTTLPSTHELRPAAADNSVEASHDSPSSSGGPDLPKQDTVVPPVGAATAAAAAAVTAIPGLALGAPVERESAGAVETAGARVGATQEQQQQREEGAQDRAQPIFLVHPPSSGHLDSITTTSAGGGGSDAHDTGGTTPLSFDHAADAHAHANALSPYTVSRSLFLLSDSYPAVRSAYVDFLSTFLRQFASRTTEEANKAAETDAFWRKLAVEFHAAAAAATATSPAEEKRMTRLAEAAFSIRSGSAVLACLPMLLSQLQTQNAIAQHALATLARTWHVNIPATTADVVVDAFASDAGVQSATGRDRAQLVETLSTRWVYGSARQAAASSLSPYLTGAPPARSLVQLGISRSRAGSTLRLSSASASASAAASAPRTPPSLARSGSGGSGHAVPGDAAHAYGASGGVSKGTTTSTTRTSLDSSLSPSAYLARRLRQQTPSLADLQAAAATSSVHDGASLSGNGSGSPGRQGSVVSSLGASAVLGSSRVGEDQRSTSRRTGRESVESLLERVGRRSARRGV